MRFKANADRRLYLPQQSFKVTNRRDYDVSLCKCGSLTVYFTEGTIASWKAEPRTTRSGQRFTLAILTALSLRTVFRHALCQIGG